MKIKKIIAVLMIMTVLLSLFCVTGNAETKEEFFKYNVVDGEVHIYGYTGKASGTFVIPEKINGYPVTTISAKTFGDEDTEIKSIVLPKTLEEFGDSDFQEAFYSSMKQLESYKVDKDNPCFSNDENGVLYNKDKTVLIDVPKNCPLKTYVYPENTEKTNQKAFSGCVNLEKVVISSSVKELDGGDFAPFDGCSSIKAFEVSKENNLFGSDENGVLYNKEKSILIRFPQNSPIKEFTLPASVKSVDVCAFKGCNNLVVINLNSVKEVYNDVFVSCANLKKITIPKTLKSFGPNVLYDCPKLTELKYEGTISEWKNIDLHGADFDGLVVCAKSEKATKPLPATEKKTEPVSESETASLKDNSDKTTEETTEKAVAAAKNEAKKSGGARIIIPITVAVVLIAAFAVVIILRKRKSGKAE